MAAHRIRVIYLHHTASRSERTTLADILRWHLARGWRDIGYHYVISRAEPEAVGEWRAYAARYQDGDDYLTAEERGAHVGVPGYSNNSNSIGVAVCGYYHQDGTGHTEPFSDEARRLVVEVLGILCRKHSLDPWRAVRGHREAPGASTVCPGNLINLDAIREDVAHWVATGHHRGRAA